MLSWPSFPWWGTVGKRAIPRPNRPQQETDPDKAVSRARFLSLARTRLAGAGTYLQVLSGKPETWICAQET